MFVRSVHQPPADGLLVLKFAQALGLHCGVFLLLVYGVLFRIYGLAGLKHLKSVLVLGHADPLGAWVA